MAQVPDATDHQNKRGHGGEPYLTEKKLWTMLEEGKDRDKERAFVILMVRIYNEAPFREEEPMERAYRALYDMGDRATMYMIRHFLHTAGIDLNPIPGLPELLGFRPVRAKKPEPSHDLMTEQELVAALSQAPPDDEPAAILSEPAAPPIKRSSQKKLRKAAKAGAGFAGKTPGFIEEPVAVG